MILTLDIQIDLLAAAFSDGVCRLAGVTAAPITVDALQHQALVRNNHPGR